jgi:hypothetical protein
VTPFRRFQASLTRALVLTMLALTTLAQGARAEDAPAATGGQPRAEGGAPTVETAPAPAAAEPAPTANPPSDPPRRFIPTEQVSEDRAVAFPKDI